MKKKVLIIWSLLVVFCFVWLCVISTQNRVYRGKEILIRDSNFTIQIETRDVDIEIEGASTNYFQLKKFDEILFASPQKPPFGYENKDYFILGKQKISEGKWEITAVGDEKITLVLNSDEDIEIVSIDNKKISIYSILFFLFSMLWLFGFDFLNRKFKK